MNIIQRTTIVLALSLALSGCFGRGKEIPDNDAAGSDVMKISPCACVQIEHKAPEFTWIG